MALQVVILAAGQGKRMRSTLPKVLHLLGGKPLLAHVLQTAKNIAEERAPIVVYGHGGEQIKAVFSSAEIVWVQQQEQLGTAHALLQTLPQIHDEDLVLILAGDVPLIGQKTLQKFLQTVSANALGMMTIHLENPTGYGRVKRNASGEVNGIVEEKDATDGERKITEINAGIYIVRAEYLKRWLPALKNNNAQQEYYLTDIIQCALKENVSIHTLHPENVYEVLGINDRAQLAQVERYYQAEQANKLLKQGVTLFDPARLDIRGEIEVGTDIIIDVNVILEGKIKIGNQCHIGPNVYLKNVELADGVKIRANSVIENAYIEHHCEIGPFARLRPGTHLADHVHVGNFVEIKNTKIAAHSKINHLSYIGDSEIGKNVNIGAGTITCNYDGANKHQTKIADNVLIGSDTMLVAPVTIGRGATIGAGSIITKDVPPEQLTITHQLKQRAIANWARPTKKTIA